MAETRLRNALDLMRYRGWGKGEYESESGALCSAGSVLRSWNMSWQELLDNTVPGGSAQSDMHMLADVLREQCPSVVLSGDDICAIAEFNDEMAQDFDHVERMFEKAAGRREEFVE